MSFKIKALLSFVLICCGGVRNEVGAGAGADDVAADDSALLTHFLKTIDAATDKEVLINVTSTILNNLCACIYDSLNSKQLSVVNENVLIPVVEAPVEVNLDQYKSIYDTYTRSCRDLPLQPSDITLPRPNDMAKCSRFDFVRKYEESFIDNQLKSKFKKIMYDILIKTKDRHKYEIKKYNLYEKPQKFEKNAMRSVIIIITLNLSKSFKTKMELNAVRLSEIDAALEDRGDIYVDFIDPAYDPKHTKISSAKNVSYCNLKSVLTVLLESEKNNLTKTFKLIRKGGTIKVYTSLSTNYAYQRYSDICCYKNNTNSFCKTTKKDVEPEVSKLFKSEQTEQVNIYKETVYKIKNLIEIYNKRLIRRQLKTEMAKTDKVQMTNNKNRYYSNLVDDHKNRSTNFSDQHFTYHYKKFVSSKLNNIPNNKKEIARNNSFLVTNHTAVDSQLNSQRTTDGMDVTNNEVTNTVEAEKIYLKVCNYDVWSNTTIKDFSPYKYIISNNSTSPNNITFTPAPLQAPTEPDVSDNSWTDIPTEPYTSNNLGTTRQNTKNKVLFQLNETDLKDSLAYNKNNNRTTIVINFNSTTYTPRSKILKTTRKFSNMFTKTYSSEETNQSFLKSIQRTSPINVLNEVNYVSLMMNSLTPSNMNINKITKRWTAPNVTRITLQESKGFNLLENNSFTTSYPSSLSTLNQSKQIQKLKINSTKSGDTNSTPTNNVTKSEWTKSSTEPTTLAKNVSKNRTLTLNKKSPKRFIDENQKKLQKKKASQNKVIQSRESKVTTVNVSSVTVNSMQTTNKRKTSYIEGSTIFPVIKGKTDNYFDLQTNAELPTKSISSLKAKQQSHPATEYSPFTLNPTIQKDTTSTSQSGHKYVDTSIFPQVPTILYSETISSTSSFFKNYSKSRTNTTHGSFINYVLNSHTNQTKTLPNSNREIHPNSILPVLKDEIIPSHSVHNVTETASPQIPTLLLSEPVASTSTYLKQYKKSYTKPIIKQFASESKFRNNQTKALTFKNSEKHQNSTTRMEQTKTTTVYTLRTENEALRINNEPSNLIIQKEKMTTYSIENVTETAVSPQIPTFFYSVPVTSASSSFKNTITSNSKTSYKDNDNKTRNNQVKLLKSTSAKYSHIHITTEKTKTKLLKYSPTPKSTDMKKLIYSNLPNATQKRKSDAKYKKNNFAKTTRPQNITPENTQVDYQNNIKKNSNETSTKDSFYEYTPFSVDEGNSNLSSQFTTSTDSSNFKEKYFTVNNNKDHHTGFVTSERESNSLLFEQQMNTAPLQKGNKISNKFTTEATVNKTKQINTKTSTENYNESKQVKTKNTFTVSYNTIISNNLINVSSTPQVLLKSKETSIPITSPKGQSDELNVGADSTFLTSTKKMKSNKKITSSKLRSRNTIDISALVQTPTVSKLKLAPVNNVVDHTRGHIDLSSPQGVGQGATFATTKTSTIQEYGVNEIHNYKNNTRNGSIINFSTYFEATKRANRIYDNFFKITQSANSIADVKVAFSNEYYDKKGIERRTSHKVNTVKISKDLFVNKIAKSILPLPNKYTKGANYKEKIVHRSSKTNKSLSKFQEVATKDGNKNEITNINTSGSNMKTNSYRVEHTLSGVFNNTTYTYPTLQRSEDSRLSQLNDIVLTTRPIQNNTTISLEPHLTGDRFLDPTSNTNPQIRVPVTFIPEVSYKELSSQNKLETITKRTPITRYKQSSSNLSNHAKQMNKSDIATTSTVSNYMQTVDTRDKKSGKPVTSKKFSVALSTLTKTIKPVNSLRIKTFNISVPTELNSLNERDQDNNMKSAEINTLSTIDHLDIKQSKEKNTRTQYSSNFKDISKTVKWFLQNTTTSEQTLAIDTFKHLQYSNESLDLSQSKIMNSSEIKTFSYSVNEIKSTKISVPFIQQNSIRLDSSQTNITNELNGKANEITEKTNVLKASISTDMNKDHNMDKEFVQTTADHAENLLSDVSSSYGKQNESVDTYGTKVSLTNTSRLIESAFSSPELTKTPVANDSNMQLSDSMLEATSSVIHLTSKPVLFEELEGTSNEKNITTNSYNLYTSTPPTYLNDNKKENLNSNNFVKANTTASEEYKQFHNLETNDTQFSGFNITDGETASWTDNILRIDQIKKTYDTHSEQFETLVYFKPLVNSTTAVLGHTSNDNQQKAVHESYGSTLKDYITSYPSNVSVEQINKSTEINNDMFAAKSTLNINNTLIPKINLSNTEHPPFAKLTNYLPEPLKTLRLINTTVKVLPDTTLNESSEFIESEVRKDDLNNIEEAAAERDRIKQSAYRTTPLTNIKLFTHKVKSKELSTAPTVIMPADNINNYNDIVQNFTNTDFVSHISSPLLQNSRSLNSYDNNTYAQYTESINLTFSSEAPPQISPDDIDSATSATNSYNESLQNIAQTLSDLLMNTKNNNSIEKTIVFTNYSKNGLNKTNTICNAPLIIASNVILLTNPERCGNQSKIKSAINMRFPLIIVTNTSNPSMNMNPDINTTNKSIIKMDPMTVYNILLENAAKIVKEPNQYLRVSDLSETPWEAINIELGYDTIASNPNTTRYDKEDELDNKTMQAIAQSTHETKKGYGSKMRQSEGDIAASVPYSHDANPNRTRTNEVTDWWLDDMYLKVRLPLPINSNPGMIFPRRRFAKLEEVADLGALLVDDLLDYKEMLDRGELPLERATSREKGQPLCMQQFYRLLGVCRLPAAGRDRLHLPPPHADDQEELVIVACRNYLYPVRVRCGVRGRRTPGELRAQLLHAMVEAGGAPAAPRLGLLTALPRDLWAAARLQLDKEPQNRANMEQISRALCVLCVDEGGGERAGADADTAAMLRAMHGAGSQHHSANRWFDKTVQLIIASDGMVGMCYEHSAAEGVAVVRLAERALARAAVAPRPEPPAAPPAEPLPAPMRWLLTPDLCRLIDHAAEDIDRQIADLDFTVYTYEGYGREFMKSCRTSPDVYIQLALQYTYFKLHGRLVSTYESASLRRFRGGRVDNIRSAHGAARAWAQAMCQPPPRADPAPDPDPARKVSFDLPGEQRKLQLFEEAARKQTSVMEDNILGRGIDNHLLGLREAAREAGDGTLPPLFTDPTYKHMMEFKLSTSQVATTTEGTCMGYGAVVPDGYGCSYNPKKDCVIFCIASFHSSRETSTASFRRALQEALDDMRRMFGAASPRH